MQTTEIITALLNFHNVVLEGVPGVGKTFAVDRVARAWQVYTSRELRANGKGKWAITLHPSTAYEDFVEGLRPDGAAAGGATLAVVSDSEPEDASGWFTSDVKGEPAFKASDGFFLRACKEAAANPDADYLILLDELNRANIPRVMGDLLTTLEHSKRAVWNGEAWDISNAAVVSLPYSGRPFFVPANLYVLATMNTSDRSVAAMDAAMRRRLAFVRLEPFSHDELLRELAAWGQALRTTGGRLAEVLEAIKPSVAMWSALNDRVLRPCVGPDAVLGHSYLFGLFEALCESSAEEPVRWADVPELAHLERLLADGRRQDGACVRRAFWMELGKTGGSDNQADLPLRGSDGGPGQPHLLVNSTGELDTETIHAIDVTFAGPTTNTEVKYLQGNKMWRWQNLPPNMVKRVFLLLESSPGNLEAHEVPREAMDVLQKAGPSDVNKGGKRWGTVKMSQQYTASRVNSVLRAWQYELLPQVADTLLAAGAETLLDADHRGEWFDGQSHVDETDVRGALSQFDMWLAQLGLRVTVPGSGIGRAPLVEVVPPAGPTADDDRAEAVEAANGEDGKALVEVDEDADEDGT